MAGITSEGLERKTAKEIREDIVAYNHANLPAFLNLDSDTEDGKFVDYMVTQYNELWIDIDQMYTRLPPALAVGYNLDQLADLTGIVRFQASPSVINELRLVGIDGQLLTVDETTFSNASGTITVKLREDVILSSTGVITEAECTVTGDTEILAGTITEIDVPVVGLSTVENLDDAQLGRLYEDDPQLRDRRNIAIPHLSKGNLHSIDANMVQVFGVTHSQTYDSSSELTISDDEVEIVVDGGLDEDVAEVIYLTRGSCGTFIGTESVIHTDSMGVDYEIIFTRPIKIPIFMIVNVNILDSDLYPGDEYVAEAVIDFVETQASLHQYNVGDDVLWSRLMSPLVLVPGCEIITMFIGTSATPTAYVDIPIAYNEISAWDIDNITVNS